MFRQLWDWRRWWWWWLCWWWWRWWRSLRWIRWWQWWLYGISVDSCEDKDSNGKIKTQMDKMSISLIFKVKLIRSTLSSAWTHSLRFPWVAFIPVKLHLCHVPLSMVAGHQDGQSLVFLALLFIKAFWALRLAITPLVHLDTLENEMKRVFVSSTDWYGQLAWLLKWLIVWMIERTVIV